MARYIDADALKAYVSNTSTHWLNEWDTVGVLAAVDKQPTIEARPVVRGEWEKRTTIIFDDEIEGYHCAFCNTTWDAATNFCPNCGADMRGDDDARSKS